METMDPVRIEPRRIEDDAAAVLGEPSEGSDARWRERWEAHGWRCFRIALRITRSEADAWAVVSEAWARAAEHDTSQIQSFEAWVATITRNQALSHVRNRRRLAARETPIDAGDHSSLLASGDPENEAVFQDALKAVCQSGGLTEAEREAFLLRALGGCSYEEIARIMGCPENSASVYIHRARKKLKALPRIQKLLLIAMVGHVAVTRMGGFL